MTIGKFSIDLELVYRITALIVMLVGLLVIPLLPGLVVIWAAALGYGIATAFGTLGWVMFAIMTVLMILGSTLDNVLMGVKTHHEGAPWWVVLIALVAAVLGNFIIPIPIIGGILLALLVLFLLEWLRRKDWRNALAAMKGMLLGCGWAVVFRFIMGLLMIGLWLIWAWA
jgi:uncharacterized protein YqgC (DUF456 family)